MREDETYLESLYSARYEYEHERKEKILTSLNFPTTLVTAFGGVTAFFLKYWFAKEFVAEGARIFFTIFVAIAAITICISLWQIFQAAYRHKYHYIPLPDKIDAYAVETRQMLAAAGIAKIDDWGTVFVRRMLLRKYVDCAGHNAGINNRRLQYRSNALLFLLVALVALVFATIPYQLLVG